MSKTLLLADDSVTIQKVVGITFASEDVELVTVDNGDDALTRAREIHPDLVLADASMPGLDGYQLCAAIKADASLQGTPVVLLTGTFEVHDESRTAEAGADAQIAKPFEAQALVDLVRRLIGSSPVSAATRAKIAPPEPPAIESELQPQPEARLGAPGDLILEGDELAIEPPIPAPARPTDATRVADPGAPVVASPPPSDTASDTDFSFSDLEFAWNATGGPPPDATQVMGDIPPMDPPALQPQPLAAEPIPEEPIAPGPALEEPMAEEPLSIDPIPEEPLAVQPMAMDPPAAGTTQPRLRSPGDSLSADADAVPAIDPLAASEQPEGDDIAYGRTTLMDPAEARELAASADIIPEEPLEPVARGPGLLEENAQAVDNPLDIEPIRAEPMPATPDDTTGPIEVDLLGEQTRGGSEIFGDPLANTAQSTGLDASQPADPPEKPSPHPVQPKPAEAAHIALDAAALQRSIEKVAWDAFGPLSEQLVREVVKKVEAIAWEVVPQMAERLVRDEIARLTEDDE